MVQILTVGALALVASATAGHNDEVNQQHHNLRKPVGASATIKNNFLGDGVLKSFLLWPYEQMLATNVNVDDDEKYHPLGSYYPRRSTLDIVDPNNVLFSLTINSKKSNVIRHRRKLRHESGHEGPPKYTMDISPSLEDVPGPIFVDKRETNTSTHEITLQHAENDDHNGSESGHSIPDGTHWEEEEVTDKAHSVDAHSQEEEHEAHSDAHDMVVHVTYADICE